jgi:hypothetical protein
MECNTTPIDGSGRPSHRVRTASMGDKMMFKRQECPGARSCLGLWSASAPGIHATDSVGVGSLPFSTFKPLDSDASQSSMIGKCRESMLDWALPGSTGRAISFSSLAPFRTRRCSNPGHPAMLDAPPKPYTKAGKVCPPRRRQKPRPNSAATAPTSASASYQAFLGRLCGW